jgi:hypothetical protein
MSMQSFSFQGKVYLGTRLAGGKPGALIWVGDAPKCDVSLQTEAEDQKESYSGNRLTSARLQKGNTRASRSRSTGPTSPTSRSACTAPRSP